MAAYEETTVRDLDWRAELANRWDPEKDYLRNPNKWLNDVTGEFAWSRQREIMQSVIDNRYTAVHSAHDLGKSFITSRLIAWWVATHPLGEAMVVSTAPTAAQVSIVMWKEVANAHAKGKLEGRINRAGYPQWYISNRLVGYGRKPSDYDESSFQGTHAKYVLVIIDEAGGINKPLFNSVDALVTNEYCRVVAIGNPDDNSSHFANICKPDSDWHVIHLDGLRSPNVSKAEVVGISSEGYGDASPKYPLLAALMEAECIPYSEEKIPEDLKPYLISPLWIEERIRRWAGFSTTAHETIPHEELLGLVRERCAKSPIFTAKVRGMFPPDGTEGVIPMAWVRASMDRWKDKFFDYKGEKAVSLMADEASNKVIGVDVARGGEDETVMAIRYGNVFKPLVRFRLADTMEIADWVAAEMHEPYCQAVVDIIGLGAGVHDALCRYKSQSVIQGSSIGFVASSTSRAYDAVGGFKFRNNRSAAWWGLREALDPSRGSNLCLPDDERLLEELVAVQWGVYAGGVIQVESKDEIKKRIGRSTDSADAVMQAMWVSGVTPNWEALEWNYGRQVVQYSDYNGITQRDMESEPGIGPGTNWLPGDETDWYNQ